jgi:hypothetical protein
MKSKMKHFLHLGFYVISIILFPGSVLAQETYKIDSNKILVQGRSFSDNVNKLFDNDHFSKYKSGKGKEYNFNDLNLIISCEFTKDSIFVKKIPKIITGSLEINSSACLGELSLGPIETDYLTIQGCTVGSFYLTNIAAQQIYFANNQTNENRNTSSISIYDSRCELMFFDAPTTEQKLLDIFFRRCNLKEISLGTSISSRTHFTFMEDSLNGDIGLHSRKDTKFSDEVSFAFFECDIRNYFNIGVKCSRIDFQECVFSRGADLSSLLCDTLRLYKCTFNSPVLFPFDEHKPIYLNLVYTNPTNLIFNYSTNIHLCFAGDSPDVISATYENLISKFKSENKMASCKNVDLEYRKYLSTTKGFIGKINYFINTIWWNFGYNNEYIIYWTVFLLTLFFIINTIKWDQMQSIYSLIPNDELYRRDEESAWRYKIRKLLAVFLYTSYIFFSLRIDFDKLKYQKVKYTAWFFIQYIIGLMCLLFIVNAVIKF